MTEKQRVENLKVNIDILVNERQVDKLELINELLAGAASMGHHDVIDALLEIRQPLVEARVDEILNR